MSMRKDAKITKCPVFIPEGTRLGFAKGEAAPGDLLTYKEHYTDGSYGLRTGRVVGRVDAEGTDGPKVEGKIAAVVLSENGTFCYERWVDPKDVTEVHPNAPKFLAYFASTDPEQLLKDANYGSACAAHMDWRNLP